MNPLGQLTQQLRQVWLGMSPARRGVMVVVFIAATGMVLGMGYWASQPDYRVLFSGLAPEDCSAITAKLQAQGIAYRLEAGGTTVMVPAENLQQTRVELAAEGLPVKGGKGFELFDQSTLGMTPFTQQVNYLRALQAELARTIMQIEPIAQARVHIVRAESSPFLRDQKPTTASIMVRLKQGANLNRNIAAGIVALVSRSVEGLARENVTIVDANGRLLSEENSKETGAIGSQMEYRRELENYLSTRAETMLSQVVGPGHALVRVTADINFQRHHEKKETYNPEARAVTKEIVTTSKSTNSGSGGARGPAGTSSNVGKSGGGSSGSSGNSQDESIQTDYAVSKTTQEFEDKMGAVERLTIAALVDLSGDAKEGAAAATALALADAQEIIKQAVGYKNGRDDIKVTNVRLQGPVANTLPDEEWQTMQHWQQVMGIVRNASLGLAALTALGMGWLALRRLRPVETAPAAGNTVAERLATTAQQDPEALARVLANWLDQSDRTERSERGPRLAA